VNIVGYLEQFARNRRRKEKSEVLTARLPTSLYSDFKTHCDDLGLSISEAVCLLVEREVAGIERDSELAITTMTNTRDDKSNEGETGVTTNVVEKNTTTTNLNTNSNINRFTVKQWKINDKLPCPICGEWKVSGNFNRHAKTHGMTTEQIFTSEEYKEKIDSMVAEKNK
jgi:hypothetical protein